MVSRKWLMGIGASSMLALSALAAPLSAAAQEDAVDTISDPDANGDVEQNGNGTIGEAEAIDAALDVVPGATATDVHLDFAYIVGLANNFDIDIDASSGDTVDVFGDDAGGENGGTNVTLNLVYVVQLSNNFNISVDASSGDVISIQDPEDENGVDEDDGVIDEDDENGADDDGSIIDDDDVNGIDDDDANGVDDEDANGVDEDDSVIEDDEDATGADDEDGLVVDDENGLVDDDDIDGVDDEDGIVEGDEDANGVEDENGVGEDDDAVIDNGDENGMVEDDDDAAVEGDDEVIEADDAVVEEGDDSASDELVTAVADTTPPVPQAQAFGFRALQVCGDGGFAEYGFENQGQCIAAAIGLAEAIEGDDAVDEENGENGAEDVVEDPNDENGVEVEVTR